jgi:hypothetical protein
VGKAEKSIFLCDYLLLAGDPTLGPRGAQVADGRVHRDTDCERDLCPLLFLSSIVRPKRYSSHLFDRCHQPARLDRWRYSSRGSVNRSKFPCQAKRHVRTTFPRTHTLCGRPAALTFGRRAIRGTLPTGLPVSISPRANDGINWQAAKFCHFSLVAKVDAFGTHGSVQRFPAWTTTE